jgi:hypothetical protein
MISIKLQNRFVLLLAFSSLCKKKIFKDVPNLDNIKVDKHVDDLFSSVFTGMGGRYTRLRILCEIVETPLNALQISKKLHLDYKTILYNLQVLIKNNLIIKEGNGYGDLYSPAPIVKSNLPTLYAVIRKVEAKLDVREKTYID